MLAEAAIQMLRSFDIRYRGGWWFEFEPLTTRFEESIRVIVHMTVEDSDVKNAPHYGNVIQSYAKMPLRVKYLETAEDLRRAFLDMLIEVEKHEAREFLSFGPDFWKPFHPHTEEGHETYWYNDPIGAFADMSFGII